jgi:hypothetical protein
VLGDESRLGKLHTVVKITYALNTKYLNLAGYSISNPPFNISECLIPVLILSPVQTLEPGADHTLMQSRCWVTEEKQVIDKLSQGSCAAVILFGANIDAQGGDRLPDVPPAGGKQARPHGVPGG